MLRFEEWCEFRSKLSQNPDLFKDLEMKLLSRGIHNVYSIEVGNYQLVVRANRDISQNLGIYYKKQELDCMEVFGSTAKQGFDAFVEMTSFSYPDKFKVFEPRAIKPMIFISGDEMHDIFNGKDSGISGSFNRTEEFSEGLYADTCFPLHFLAALDMKND